MSDAPDQRRGATAPLPMTVQPSPSPIPAPTPATAARAATQMSPAAKAEGQAIATDKGTALIATDEIDGAVLARDVSAPPPPVTQDPGRRGGPATLMSPAVALPGDVAPSPPLSPENAVIDVGAPAHAFLPHGSAGSPPYGGGPVMAHRAHASGDAAGRRGTSTSFMVLVVVGVVAGVVLLAGILVALFYVAERRKADAERLLHPPSVAAPAATPEAPRGPPHFGGGKARLGVTTTGTLDPEAIRVALAGVLPRIDGCFVTAELEPPNHESAAYDLDVQPNGEVKRADVATTTPNRAPKLDACVLASLRGVHLPKSARASSVKLTFSAPLDVH